jgi:hypothetical protein
MIVQSISILQNDLVVGTFSEAIGPTEGKNYMVSSESTAFLSKGHVGRNIKSDSSFVLCTIRPTDAAVDGDQWEIDFRKDISEKKLVLKTTYSYYHLPLWGPLLRGTKISPLT